MDGKIYLNDKYLCDASSTEGLPIVTASPEEPEEHASRSIVEPVEYTFTAKIHKMNIPKAWRRFPICKSRKRYVKKLMGYGMSRNSAIWCADMARRWYGSNPYQKAWIMYVNSYYDYERR